MGKHIKELVVVIACLAGVCCLASLRFQSVEATDKETARAHHYWRVLLPGQDSDVELQEDGSYEARTYGITGLYGLWSVEEMSGFQSSHRGSF